MTLAAVAQPEVRPLRHILGAGHGASFLPSINTLGGGSVGVEGDEGVGRQASGRYVDVEATGEMGGDVGVGLKVSRQRGQRRLGVCPATAADLKMRRGHDGRWEGPLDSQDWRLEGGGRSEVLVDRAVLCPVALWSDMFKTGRVSDDRIAGNPGAGATWAEEDDVVAGVTVVCSKYIWEGELGRRVDASEGFSGRD